MDSGTSVLQARIALLLKEKTGTLPVCLLMIALTATQASDFFADPSNRVGMLVPTGSPITYSGDGPENFYLVPTPGVSAVFGLSLLAATRRRR